MLKDLLLGNDWMVSIDLKDAYFRGRAQVVSLLCLGRSDVQISVPPFWIEQYLPSS